MCGLFYRPDLPPSTGGVLEHFGIQSQDPALDPPDDSISRFA
jgi:hypothetical protein